jgi:hypothetical protein
VVLKVLESPFELLAAVASVEGRSGQNLQYVPLPAGRPTLTPAAKCQLSAVSDSMQNRPGLSSDVDPRVNPGADRHGLGTLTLNRLVRMQKVEETRAQVNSAELATFELTPHQSDKYLRVVSKQTKGDKLAILGSDELRQPESKRFS